MPPADRHTLCSNGFARDFSPDAPFHQTQGPQHAETAVTLIEACSFTIKNGVELFGTDRALLSVGLNMAGGSSPLSNDFHAIRDAKIQVKSHRAFDLNSLYRQVHFDR